MAFELAIVCIEFLWAWIIGSLLFRELTISSFLISPLKTFATLYCLMFLLRFYSALIFGRSFHHILAFKKLEKSDALKERIHAAAEELLRFFFLLPDTIARLFKKEKLSKMLLGKYIDVQDAINFKLRSKSLGIFIVPYIILLVLTLFYVPFLFQEFSKGGPQFETDETTYRQLLTPDQLQNLEIFSSNKFQINCFKKKSNLDFDIFPGYTRVFSGNSISFEYQIFITDNKSDLKGVWKRIGKLRWKDLLESFANIYPSFAKQFPHLSNFLKKESDEWNKEELTEFKDLLKASFTLKSGNILSHVKKYGIWIEPFLALKKKFFSLLPSRILSMRQEYIGETSQLKLTFIPRKNEQVVWILDLSTANSLIQEFIWPTGINGTELKYKFETEILRHCEFRSNEVNPYPKEEILRSKMVLLDLFSDENYLKSNEKEVEAEVFRQFHKLAYLGIFEGSEKNQYWLDYFLGIWSDYFYDLHSQKALLSKEFVEDIRILSFEFKNRNKEFFNLESP